ncbi:TPA: methylenetetrahydrofolate reductase [Candidatus Woesearchaeota archaeon]|nr:methylenetetrahydrofolate reductase [Candidatus Woesearchaeota archaeon]HII69366.1 methylenetetrahydrofolate reductase [Candidatus Woesearchaeota archaeon]
MKKITDILKKRFTRSVELVPPRNGTDPQVVWAALEELKSIPVDFISVTKGAGGSLRGGTTPICHLGRERYGLTPVAHFTCREITARQVESELVDHHYFGIRNILALRGDPPEMSDEAEWKGDYAYAHQLVSQIAAMNRGEYLCRRGKDDESASFHEGIPTDFCIGVAAHPEGQEDNVQHLKEKVDAGAEFAITQMVFDVNLYASFVSACRKEGIAIPIIPGIWPLDKKWKILAAQEKFGATIPKPLAQRLLSQDDHEEFRKNGMLATVELCRAFKQAGAPGVHLFLFLDAVLAKEIFSQL